MAGAADAGTGGAAAGMFAADEEVGRDLAAVDWAATPLGPPDSWPQSLQTAVDILLSSRFPMWMAWGPRLTFFCNAAYRRVTLGRKYPWALGRPASKVWAEIWGDIGPRIDTVLATGSATWDEALLLFLERSGYPEESYHTFSYSPLRDDAGTVVGMLCVVSEDTERIIGERRMATLRDLGSDPSAVRTEQETLDFAGRQLTRNRRDLPFTLTYLFEDDGATARLAVSTGIAAGHPAAPAALEAGRPDSVWPAATLLRGESALVDLAGAPFTRLPAGVWSEPPGHALIAPLAQPGGAPYGFLVAALNRYRPLDEGYRGFVELVARHLAAGIASARGYEDQQRRAEELAALDRAKTTFFSNISHEFRTPLTLIVGPVQELQRRLADADPVVREDLEVISRNGLRLGRLVNTLLDFSRIEAGRMQASYEPADIAELTAELASVFRSAIDRAGLAFEVDCRPLPEPVYLDRSMWEKVVLNLLSNALKFTFDGSIRIAARAEGGQAVVTVADTGVGIPAREMPRLFERFHRIENTRGRSNEGSGIGLALVQELVQLHGGTITASSIEGEGSTFTVRLPFGHAHLPDDALAPADHAAAVSATADPFVQEALRWLPRPARNGDDGTRPRPVHEEITPGGATDPSAEAVRALFARVLVADDNADMREYLARLLRTAGYQVTRVPDGQAALDAIRASPPDLVISDVMMPRMDGLELVAALRADVRTAAVPVLLLSARAGQEASIQGLQAGADDYLVKPFSAAELLARVRANVELARTRTHHARWRTALVDSLQEAFFVCAEDGAVIEINSAFTDILGYGSEGLPYRPVHPWWPDPAADPEAHRHVAGAFAQILDKPRGGFTIPVSHRDGHRVWISVAFNQVQEPDTGRRVIVGTFRDVTAEHYAMQRETALASLSVRLTRAEDLADALRGALEEFQGLWHAACVLAAVFHGSGDPEVSATDPDLDWENLPGTRRRALAALRAGPPLTPVADDPAGAAIALEHPRGTLVLWIDLGEKRLFTEPDQLLLTALASHLGQGLQRVHQIDQQRETALALQRAILGPSQLPPGFAVRYEPAVRPLKVGGDWYDTVALPDGRIGIVVGDCVGHDLEAATVMGQLRSACRALLLQDASPARTLEALDHFAVSVPGAMCTTVFCAVLDTATGQLAYSSAGHPPGILAHPDGSTELLEQGLSVPLALRPGMSRPEARHILPARATLLLYTDGLVERRRRPLDEGIARAVQVLHEGYAFPVDALASRLMAGLAPPGGYEDDVALLLYRHPAPLEIAFPAETGQLPLVRTALREWLNRCGLDPSAALSVLVAAGEACSNAVEHGHRSAGGTIRLLAAATADALRLTVIDTGTWKPPQPQADAGRGRGISLMRALVDRVTVSPQPAGTTVDIYTRITR